MAIFFAHKNLGHILHKLFIVLIFITRLSLCEPRAKQVGLVCSREKASDNQRQIFVANFLGALDSLTSQVAFKGYGYTTNGTKNLTVYGFAECMSDVTGSDCSLCFAQIKTDIDKCLPYERLTRGGRVFFDGCYLRYDDHDFKGEVLSTEDKTVCGTSNFTGNQTIFKENVGDVLKNFSAQSVNNSGFYVGSLEKRNVSVFVLAQCWEYLNSSACRSCLDNAVARVSECPPKNEGRALNSGCYLRYYTKKFYKISKIPPFPVTQAGGASHRAVILAATLSAAAFVVILATAIFIGREKFIKWQKERKTLRSILCIANNSKLNYSYESLEVATNYFHKSNKLGQGGSGSVYKGTLPDGTVVAVKRLFFNTRQWADHFFNEIDLISSIEQKNLVKLLGCSVTGPESLLVYEFVPNYSLEHHIFGKSSTRPLTWDERYKIIVGIAEGLAYLHEEAKLKIIHRDIKLSNVLLEPDFTPKIADFGLVRLLPEDKTHLTTAVAGTLGYMAPEYLVCGILTEKADVYSFGVLLIEVVTGKKNSSSFSQDSMCMLHTIWSLQTRGKLNEAIDKALEGKYPILETSRVLQIGLLCVQANAEVRPSMSTVVQMLIDKELELHEPTQPPFLNASSAEITRQIQDNVYSPAASQSSSSGSGRSTEPLNT